MAKPTSHGQGELRVTNFPQKSKEQLENYVKRMGLNMSAYVKKLVIDDLNAKPEHLKMAIAD